MKELRDMTPEELTYLIDADKVEYDHALAELVRRCNAASRWTAVTPETMPPKLDRIFFHVSEFYDVGYNDPHHMVGYYFEGPPGRHIFQDKTGNQYAAEDVTDWMPIPPLPEGE